MFIFFLKSFCIKYYLLLNSLNIYFSFNYFFNIVYLALLKVNLRQELIYYMYIYAEFSNDQKRLLENRRTNLFNVKVLLNLIIMIKQYFQIF